MFKKLLFAFLILGITAFFAVGVLSRKAPELLRASIQKALNKPVSIQSIRYHFPGTFELKGFQVQEKEPFAGEVAFYVDDIRLSVSVTSFAQKKLLIDSIEVEKAQIVVRKIRGKMMHAFSDAMKKPEGVPSAPTDTNSSSASPQGEMPLEIQKFILKESQFKYVDYDVADGFVMALDQIDATIENIRLPFSSEPTTYEARARWLQGRDQPTAEFAIKGWTEFVTKNTDANAHVRGLFIPYFAPYYSQITPAGIANGFLEARSNLRVDNNNLMLNSDLEIGELLFQSYESDNQLFGLNADQILSFLKDSSGKLKFQIAAGWNLADRSVRPKDIIRQSIERSLKKTVLGNVGNILQNTLLKLGEGGADSTKGEVEDTVKKIKDFLKFD